MEDLRSHPEFVHDEELWVTFTEDIVRGMGGDAAGARACAADMVRRWEIHENFHLYDDALPVLASLREHRLSIGLISNGQRDLEEFAHAPPAARRLCRRVEGAREDEAARLDLRARARRHSRSPWPKR